jgi:hypothetical protein
LGSSPKYLKCITRLEEDFPFLIGKSMFAVDGCKIASNCAKEWSGTKKELKKG